MRAWKHILDSKNLGIVLAPSRRSAERMWKRFYPQSEDADSTYFLEETHDFSEMSGPEGIKDWNDQLSRRQLMEHNISMDERVCPLSSFEGDSCKSCLSWTVCPYNELTNFAVDRLGRLVENLLDEDITSEDFERREFYEASRLKRLKEYESDIISLI